MAKKFILNQIEAGDRPQLIAAASNQRAEPSCFWRSAKPGTALKWGVINQDLRRLDARHKPVRSYTS